jgi:hypothetical protein
MKFEEFLLQESINDKGILKMQKVMKLSDKLKVNLKLWI